MSTLLISLRVVVFELTASLESFLKQRIKDEAHHVLPALS